jgi:uncharacterized protein (DUF4213/DUF364 family)
MMVQSVAGFRFSLLLKMTYIDVLIDVVYIKYNCDILTDFEIIQAYKINQLVLRRHTIKHQTVR